MKSHVKWGDVEWGCQRIADAVAGEEFDVIVPVVRGGLIPGVILSEILGIKKVVPITLQLRDGKVCDNDIKEWTSMVESSYNMLVVEDIMDSGATMDVMHERLLRNKLPGGNRCVFSALVVNDDAKPKYFNPKDVVRAITLEKDSDPDLWIVFPWDK